MLGLIASTNRGVTILHELGWEAVKHRRGEEWPVIDEDEEDDSLELLLEMDDSTTSLGSEASKAPYKRSTPVEDSTSSSHSQSLHGSSPRVSFFIESSPAKSPSSMVGSVSVESSSFHSSDQLGTILEHHGSESDEGGDVVDAKMERSPMLDKHVNRRSISERRAARQGSHSPAPVVHFKLEDVGEHRVDAGDTAGEKGRVIAVLAENGSSEKEQACGILEIIEEKTVVEDEESETSMNPVITSSVVVKPRSDSLNTDTTTSGFSSYESGPCVMTDSTRLTPTPGVDPEQHHTAPSTPTPRDDDIPPLVHPSDVLRKLSNLKRIPSLKRRYSNPVLGHVSHRVNVEECEQFAATYMYTPSRGTQGYATLRALQRQRTRSLEESAETEKGTAGRPPQQSPSSRMKSRSLDFRLGRPK